MFDYNTFSHRIEEKYTAAWVARDLVLNGIFFAVKTEDNGHQFYVNIEDRKAFLNSVAQSWESDPANPKYQETE